MFGDVSLGVGLREEEVEGGKLDVSSRSALPADSMPVIEDMFELVAATETDLDDQIEMTQIIVA